MMRSRSGMDDGCINLQKVLRGQAFDIEHASSY